MLILANGLVPYHLKLEALMCLEIQHSAWSDYTVCPQILSKVTSRQLPSVPYSRELQLCADQVRLETGGGSY